ncbi:MAG: choice-of-anchor L domain-containing protein [Thalassovita sp.]
MVAAQELSIDTSASANEMAEAMFGDGITIVSSSYTGSGHASGIYSGADATMPGVAPSDSGVILSTGRATDITNSSGEANQSSKTTTNNRYAVDNDEGLNEIAGMTTYDGAIFEATFVPDGAVLTMQLTFSSEEYLEWVDSGYNDAVGIWVNGEQADLTLGDSEISIDEINPDSNSDWYIDNANSEYNTEMDGMTITLTLSAPVTPGEENTIRIGIADAGDSKYDSNLMIAGDSIQTVIVAEEDDIEVSIGSTAVFDVLENDSSSAGGTLTITHINGQSLVEGVPIVLASGAEVVLGEDGMLSVTGADEEDETTFIYSISDGLGHEGSGYATISTIPCFVTGTAIDTARGQILVEDLQPGDLVLTRDHGYQRLRWSGECKTLTTPVTAPVEISANTFGNHGNLCVSPQHRVLFTGASAQLLFDTSEVLVAAKHLVDGRRVRRQKSGTQTTYMHLLFDQHEVLRSNGLWTESYMPGPATSSDFDANAQAEVLALFPQLDLQTGKGYGAEARLSLRQHEAQALLVD